MIRAGTTRTVLSIQLYCPVRLPSVELTQYVLCNTCSNSKITEYEISKVYDIGLQGVCGKDSIQSISTIEFVIFV